MDHYFSDLGKVYEKMSVIKESPDSIIYKGREYEYDDPHLNNYSGVLNENGKFAMSNLYKYHMEFIENVSRGHFNGVKTNCKDKQELLQLIRGASDFEYFRIWSKFNIISFWSSHRSELIQASIEAIKSIKKDPMIFLYDVSNDGRGDTSDMLSYDEFISEPSDNSDFEEKRNKLLRQQRDFANWMLKKVDGD